MVRKWALPELLATAWMLLWQPGAWGAPGPTPEEDAVSVLTKHCAQCHTGSKAAAGLDLSSAAAALRGGTNGPVASLGHPEESVLLKRVVEKTMPPKGIAPLSD